MGRASPSRARPAPTPTSTSSASRTGPSPTSRATCSRTTRPPGRPTAGPSCSTPTGAASSRSAARRRWRRRAARSTRGAWAEGQYDLYRVDLEGGDLERLTDDEVWDDTDAAIADGPDGPRLLFVSDRNGVPNLYGRALGGDDAPRPLTDLQTGVIDVSLSVDGSRAVFLALDDGSPGVFFLRDPFGRATTCRRP